MAVFSGVTESGARSGRLLSILLLLQARHTATARELADELGVSMRTVYRDVEVLSRIGVPVYAETGRAGGYRLVDGYRTTLTGLTAQESLALFLIGLPAPAASLGLSEPARSAEAKLLAALGPVAREQANRLRGRFLLDLPAWYADTATPPALPGLADAVPGAGPSRARSVGCSTRTGWSSRTASGTPSRPIARGRGHRLRCARTG
jgi:biotin operon repressor